MRVRSIRPLVALLALAALVPAAAACGGGDDDDDQGRQRPAAAPGPAVAAPRGQEYATPVLSGETEIPDTKPGRVVADSGFDLRRDGFSFENYGLSIGGPHLRAQEIRELFGDGVCAGGTSGDGCTLRPAAERWRTLTREFADGGHCYGFSLLSLQLRNGVVDESLYGGTSAFDLRLTTERGLVVNPELHADLGRSAVTQFIPAIRAKERRYTANETLDILRKNLASGGGYIISLFSADPNVTVGHAVVPIRIEDMGGGKFDIVLYDNNFPWRGDTPDSSNRRMHIDTNRNTWEYTLSVLPDAKQDKFTGQGETNKIFLAREEDHRLPQPCPVCKREGLGQTMVGLTGDVNAHGHLRITDGQGRVTGFQDGELVNEIPGAEVVRPLLNKIWLAEPEPVYLLPEDGDFTIELVDVPEGAPEQAIQAAGRDLGVGLTGLTEADEGTRLRLGGDERVALTPGGDEPIAGQLQVAAGTREIQIDPSAERVALRRAAGDVVLTGSAERVGVVDVKTGTAGTAPTRPGRIDLSEVTRG